IVHDAVREITAQIAEVWNPFLRQSSKDPFRLGGKGEQALALKVAKWLHPKPIARTEQFTSSGVPQRKCPHAVEAVQAVTAPLRISCENDLGVRVGAERMAARSQFRPQLQVVEDFTVEHDHQAAIRRGHGLM